jgi:hypothetical protein
VLAAGLILLAATAAPAQSPAPAPASGLRIAQITLHDRRESAPAIPAAYQYRSGELMFFSFRVAGYAVRKDRADLRWQLFATDPDGLLLFDVMRGAVQEEVTHADEQWLPRVALTIPLPAQLPPGTYRLRALVSDELAGKTAEAAIPFEVGGPPIPRPDSFSILNAAFYKTGSGGSPMDPAVYLQGDDLFARFNLAGFKLGEKNRFHVVYGVRMLRPSGNLLYEQPVAAEETDAPFYPKRLMMGGLSLTLSPDLTPGEYTMILFAEDRIGGQKAEHTITFRVEKAAR